MNELLFVTENVMVQNLKDKDLQAEVLLFNEYGAKSLENVYSQYLILEKIRNKELWRKDFATYSDATEQLFGIGKAQANRMVQIAETFLHGEKAEEFKKFTPSALVEMLPKGEEKSELTAHKEKLLKLVDNGDITPADTKTDVRETVREKIRGEKPKDDKPKVEKASKEKDLQKAVADLKAYAKKKNDKYLTGLAKRIEELTK